MDSISELVFTTLKEQKEAMKSGQLAELLKIDKKDLDKAIKVLVKEEKIYSPKRCFYSPK